MREKSKKSEELAAMAHARAKEKGIPYTDALLEIALEEREFVAAARQEVLGGKAQIVTIRPSFTRLQLPRR